MSPYAVVLADDHVMFRQGIRNLIENLGDIVISGEVNDGQELLQLLETAVPDLILLDIAMPRMRGLEALREVKKKYPGVKILILTMHGNKEFVRQAVADGAEGFLLKEEPSSELIRAIHTIKAGKTYFSSRLSSALIGLVREAEEIQFLSRREKEVLKCLANGMSTREISDALFISSHTVRRHRQNISQKLKVRRLADLVKYALSQGYGE